MLIRIEGLSDFEMSMDDFEEWKQSWDALQRPQQNFLMKLLRLTIRTVPSFSPQNGENGSERQHDNCELAEGHAAPARVIRNKQG